MSKTSKYLIQILMLAIMLLPAITLAVDPAPSLTPLVTCKVSCGWKDLMNLINRVINFLLFVIALPLAALRLAWVGGKLAFLSFVNGGEEGWTQLKTAFFDIVIGLFLAAGAWVIIKALLWILGYNGAWIGF